MALYHLGWMYANGEGLAVDEVHAVELWRKAAEQGHSEAQFRIAMAYLNGEGVESDPAQAAQWLKRLAAAGDADSRAILLQMIRDGEPAAVTLAGDLLRDDWRALGEAVTVNVAKGNLRRGPGTDQAVVQVLKQGDRRGVIGQEGKWLRVGVVGSGTLAWVHESLLE
jgi:TPR repeat protein